MKKSVLHLFLAAMAAGVSLASCSNEEPVAPETGEVVIVTPLSQRLSAEEISELGNVRDAQWRFFQTASNTDITENNVVCSPLGMQLVLSMLSYGVEADAAQEIVKALGCNSMEALHDANRVIIDNLSRVADNTTVSMANSLWYSNNFNVLESFTNPLTSQYGAEIFAEDFSGNVKEKINTWCKNKTNGEIRDFLSDNPKDIALINALYFNSPWVDKFDKSETRDGTFHGKNGDVTVKMMSGSKSSRSSYTLDPEQPSAVTMLCGGGGFSATFIMPPLDMDIDEFIATYDVPSFLEGMFKLSVECILPKMELTPEKVNMTECLTKLGIEKVFSDGATGILADQTLKDLQALQQTTVQFDEEGAKAASVTFVGGLTSNGSMTIRFDRPFVFLIQEESTGIILFAGKVVDL